MSRMVAWAGAYFPDEDREVLLFGIKDDDCRCMYPEDEHLLAGKLDGDEQGAWSLEWCWCCTVKEVDAADELGLCAGCIMVLRDPERVAAYV